MKRKLAFESTSMSDGFKLDEKKAFPKPLMFYEPFWNQLGVKLVDLFIFELLKAALHEGVSKASCGILGNALETSAFELCFWAVLIVMRCLGGLGIVDCLRWFMGIFRGVLGWSWAVFWLSWIIFGSLFGV